MGCCENYCLPKESFGLNSAIKTNSIDISNFNKLIAPTFALQISSEKHFVKINSNKMIKQHLKNTDNDLVYKRKLTLKVIESKSLPIGCQINMIHSKINDTFTKFPHTYLFGKSPESNDFILSSEENVGVNQFVIKYNKRFQFRIKDLKSGTGCFVKINEKHELDHDIILSFSDCYLLIYKVQSDNILKMKFILGLLNNQLFCFNPIQETNITIGRSKSSRIIYKEETTSRLQLSFVFENNKWIVYDGEKNSPSTNGLWNFAIKSILIKHGSIIKSGNTLYLAQLSDA